MEAVAPGGISAREAEVLDSLGEHLTNAEIARRLHISVRTVESHVSSLLRKLGATDRRRLAALAVDSSPWESGGRSGPAEVTGLPSNWTTFVGRTAELEELSELVASNRLVTVVGSGGVGKTRLAAVAAGQAALGFSGGGAFVDLVPVRPEFVVEAVAAALGVIERAQEPLEQRVRDRLRAGRMLLVLDNCEHVLPTVAAFTASTLADCPDLTVLATSRERLGLIGERVMSLTPLALTAVAGADGSEAELLFVDRASGAAGVRTGSSLVSDICCHLDGMPLAIELAAARAGSLGLDGLLAGLDDHLRLLSRSGNPRDSARLHAHRHRVEPPAAGRGRGDPVAAARRVRGVVRPGRRGVGDGRWGVGPHERRDRPPRRQEPARAGPARRHQPLAHARHDPRLRGGAARGERRAPRSTGPAPRVGGDHRGRHRRVPRRRRVAGPLRRRLRRPPAALRSAAVRCGDGTDFALALSLGHLSYARRFLVEARDHLDDAVGRAPDEASAVTALHVGASATYAEMRGEAAYHLLRAAHTRAMAAGDTRAAAIALADASALAGRCPALFVQPVTHEELVGLVAEARTLTAPDDLEAMVHLALAEAWDSSRAPSVGDLGRAEEALALTTRFGDPLLISSALDAKASAVSENGLRKEALRITSQRLALLSRLPRHDPRVGGEVVDIFHMACEGALGAGEVHRSLEMARSQHVDSSSRGLPHFAANHLVTPLMLQGEFDEALAQAAIMREGWERAGAPAAGWMAPSFFATAMIHGLRGDQGGYDEFWNLAMTIRMQASANSFAYFVGPWVALYEGALDRAGRSVSVDDEVLCGPYAPYAQAISVEVAVATGAPDAVDRLAAAEGLAEENDYAAAYLLRAAGRLHDDEATLKQAVLQWESLGARFERACTLLLLPEHATEGADELRALGCTTPPGLKRGRSPLA